MDYSASLETVYQAIFSLNKDPNPSTKQNASRYLDDLQNSIHAWKIADDMLHQKRDLESCYFAAQTLRKKIQASFHELPGESHASLRDSLLSHVSQIDRHTDSIIVTQLCLALADLILQMPSWQNPITDLTQRFGSDASRFWLLLEILIVLPEEIDSRSLRLSAERKDQVVDHFCAHGDSVLRGLLGCLVSENDARMAIRVFRCLTSWSLVGAIPLTVPVFTQLIDLAFEVLGNNACDGLLHEAASDCVSATLEILERDTSKNKFPDRGEPMTKYQKLQLHIFDRVITLKPSYQNTVALGDIDKSTNYCRIFTELAESFLKTLVDSSSKHQPHFIIAALDLVLECAEHRDHEVSQITFGLWYRLSELLFRKKDDRLAELFESHVERLVHSLLRLCQMDPDRRGLLDDGCDFADFRRRVRELIKDVAFIVGSRKLFSQVVSSVGQSWETIEAALFVMHAVARIIPPEDDRVVPSVVEGILNLPEATHVAVKHTSILLLGELGDWVNEHPQTLQPTLNFLFNCLNKTDLSSSASNALQNICAACPSHMTANFDGLMHIARSLDSFAITGLAANDLLKGIAKVLSKLSRDELEGSAGELCWLQAKPLCRLVEDNIAVQSGTETDPIFWLDRLSIIFRYAGAKVGGASETHPLTSVANEMWSVLSAVLRHYQADSRVMERCCRSLRFLIRCLAKHSVHILEPLVDQMVQQYATHKHSCFLYLGSILVDVFSSDNHYNSKLLGMMEAFVSPTFVLLQETDGLKNNPSIVDDLFRLCTRFLQTALVPFLLTSGIDRIIDCAMVSCSLDHKEANASVMKFLFLLIHSGRNDKSKPDFSIRNSIVRHILQNKGHILVWRLLHAVAFSLSTYALPDVADVFSELCSTDVEMTSEWLKRSLCEMVSESERVTGEKLLKFHGDVVGAKKSTTVVDALRNFARLFQGRGSGKSRKI